jgi:flagellar biosynthesis chaperone FliJ
MDNSYNKQLRLLYQLKQSIKQNGNKYEELVTGDGRIHIPTKAVIKALNSSIEHYKSKINELKQSNNE